MINQLFKYLLFVYLLFTNIVVLLGQLVVNGTSLTVSSNTSLRVDGHLMVDINSYINVQGSLSISGNFTGKGLFQDIKKLSFYGSQPSHLLMQNGFLDTLDISKLPFAKIFIDGDSVGVNYLQFSKDYNTLEINDASIAIKSDISGFKQNSYILTTGNGLIERKLSSFPSVFPVGDDKNGFQPLFISTSSQLGSEVAKVGFILSDIEIGNNLNRQGIWRVENNCPIQIHYLWGPQNNINTNVFNIKDLRLKGWNGIDWELIELDTLVGGVEEGRLITRIIFPDEFQFYKFESVSNLNERDVKKGRNIELLPSFPNPFSDGTMVNFKLKEESLVTIQLYSPNGYLLKESKQKYTPGYHFEKFNEHLFQVSGNYLLIIKNEGDIFQTKLLKINY